MRIISSAIVSNSDIIKNYKSCRDKAEVLGRVYVLKNNQPDAVLFSVSEYERISPLLEYLERIEENDMSKVVARLSGQSKSETLEIQKEYENNAAIEYLKNDIIQA